MDEVLFLMWLGFAVALVLCRLPLPPMDVGKLEEFGDEM